MKREFQNFITLGYYICPIADTPSYLNTISKKFISVSECLCDHQPQLSFCAGWKPDGDNEDYRKKYHLSSSAYQMMSAEIGQLFANELFYSDGRFLRKEDAVLFYKTYFRSPEIILACLKTEQENIRNLDDGFTYTQEKETDSTSRKMLGYDIIGWDVGGFHSFLCNHLHKEFNHIKFTALGLLDMDYREVAAMAQMIQGKGEPVDWMACRVEEVIV